MGLELATFACDAVPLLNLSAIQGYVFASNIGFVYNRGVFVSLCTNCWFKPSADFSPAEPASVLTNDKILFLHLLSVKLFS